MKKINTFLIICFLLISMLITSYPVENVKAITQHEVNDGLTYGSVLNDTNPDELMFIIRPKNAGDTTLLSRIGDTSNYLCVDEEIRDNDTSYVYTDGSSWKLDLYNMDNPPLSDGFVTRIRVYAWCGVRDDGGQRKISIKTGGTTYQEPGGWIGLSKNYNLEVYQWTNNPDTSEAWTFTEITNLQCGVSLYNTGITGIHQTRCTQIYTEVYYHHKINVTRTIGSVSESNIVGFIPQVNYITGNVILKIPVSTEVQGIIDVTNNTNNIFATEVNNTNELINNTFWYNPANQFVYIGTTDLTISQTVNWTINCSYGATFNLIIPAYLEVGQYFHSEGFIIDENNNAIPGLIAETRVLYANGTDALVVNPKWNCTSGNFRCVFSTSNLMPGVYSISIEFTDPISGVIFKEGSMLYLSTTPGEDIHVVSNLHFTFYNNNTGMGLNPELFKIYASDDTVIDSSDRIYVSEFITYTGKILYYRVDDYFDNQIYPRTGSYQTLSITDVEQFEDIPIDWYSFSVKNMNHSIVHFNMTSGNRTYSQYLYPYEPFYWDVLNGTYTINLTYYNTETDAIVDYLNDTIEISTDTYYWIRGYDLQDIIIEIQITNSSLGTIVLDINTNIGIVNSTVSDITTTIITDISLFESNITNLVNNVWNQLNITDSMISYLNTTVNVNILKVNTTINYINDTVWRNFTLLNETINNTHISIITSIDLSEQNLTSLQLDIWTSLNLTDSVVDYINNTLWSEFTFINTTINTIDNKLTINFDMLNVTVDFINNTIWTEFNTVNSNINNIGNTVVNVISLSESNLTTLNNNIWNSINITDTVITYLNNTLWNEISAVNVTIDYINNNIWTNFTAIESDIGSINVDIHSGISLMESNLTTLNNNIWNSINITDSIITYLNNTLWNEISAVNVTIDYLNNTIWTNLSLIDSDINNLNVSIHTSLSASETNISNIIYNVWSALNLTNATIDYLNASIWNELSIIQSNLNNTNLSIKNIILLMENNITSLVITIENIIDYALMPDIEIISYNPPMIFSMYDKKGMAIGGNIYQICPALITVATTRVETTGNWINSTARIPGNDTVTNGTIVILEDTLYISGSGSINYINITYTDNNTLMQNTTYIPSKINLYGQNLTINASDDIHILRETKYNQVEKFYWIYNSFTGRHTAGIDIINPMDIPIYDVYVYVEFSNKSTADPNTVIMKDISNSGIVLKRGESYDVTLSGIHFYLLSINADSTRGFTIEYTKRFDDAYRYGEETINIPGYIETAWNGLSFNTFDISWTNDEDTIFRGALYGKIDFEADIDSSSVRVWDEDNNCELDESDFVFGTGFIRIDADGLGDINPGGGRSFSVYFLLTEYPGVDPKDIHLNTPLFTYNGFAVTPFLFILLISLILIGYSFYSYIYKNKNWKSCANGIVLGVFIIFIFSVMAYMGV